MMAETQDRRSLRSRRLLWDALLGLLQDTDWAEINVQMICDRADVARSTFYAHFQTKQDLLDAGFAAGVAEIGRMIATGPLEPGPLEPGRLASLDWLVGHVAGSVGFHGRIQGSAAGHTIMTRFQRMMRELLQSDLARHGIAASDADMDFVTGGIFAVINSWIAQGCKENQSGLIRRLRRQMDAVLGA